MEGVNLEFVFLLSQLILRLLFQILLSSEAYSEPSRTSIMELFVKIVNIFLLLTIFAKTHHRGTSFVIFAFTL